MRNHISAILLSLTATVSATAAAHHLFIVPDSYRAAPGDVLTLGVHNADSFPDSESIASRFDGLELYAAGDPISVSVREDGKRLVGDARIDSAGHVFATAATAPAVIELDAEEFTDYLREEGLAHVIEWRERYGEADEPGRERYAKYAKSIMLSGGAEADETHARMLGLPIEIVPEKSPYRLTVGEVLPVRVLFHGAPAANLEVKAAWISENGAAEQRIVGRTDADGRLNVPLDAAGPWRLHTILMERRSEPDVDWQSYWATLTFSVPQER